MIRLLLSLCLLVTASVGFAEERSSLWPNVPAATGAPHPEGNEYWRKHHMELMKHDRNLTMRLGDREIAASLKSCFNCHAATDDHGNVVTYASEKHFCRVCHDFAAVKVDCFMCHRSTPDGVDETAEHAAILPPEPGRITGGETGSIVAWLADVATREAGQ